VGYLRRRHDLSRISTWEGKTSQGAGVEKNARRFLIRRGRGREMGEVDRNPRRRRAWDMFAFLWGRGRVHKVEGVERDGVARRAEGEEQVVPERVDGGTGHAWTERRPRASRSVRGWGTRRVAYSRAKSMGISHDLATALQGDRRQAGGRRRGEKVGAASSVWASLSAWATYGQENKKQTVELDRSG
jgi:hypothetical protein